MLSLKYLIVITLLNTVYSAPSPYFTRSFVKTPSSSYEQYLIVPDKNDAYRVPLSQVHHYSDFEFPKQQVVYYNPSSASNQHALHTLKKDNPIWQQMLLNLHSNSDENLLMEQPIDTESFNDKNENEPITEKLKREDSKNMEEMTTSASTQPIVVNADMETDRNGEILFRDINQENQTENIQAELNSDSRNKTSEENTHPEMTQALIPGEKIDFLQNESSEMNLPENIRESVLSRIEHVNTLEPLTTTETSLQEINEINKENINSIRQSKEMAMEIIEDPINSSEFTVRLFEVTTEKMSELEYFSTDKAEDSIFTEKDFDSTTENSITEQEKIMDQGKLDKILKMLEEMRNQEISTTSAPILQNRIMDKLRMMESFESTQSPTSMITETSMLTTSVVDNFPAQEMQKSFVDNSTEGEDLTDISTIATGTKSVETTTVQTELMEIRNKSLEITSNEDLSVDLNQNFIATTESTSAASDKELFDEQNLTDVGLQLTTSTNLEITTPKISENDQESNRILLLENSTTDSLMVSQDDQGDLMANSSESTLINLSEPEPDQIHSTINMNTSTDVIKVMEELSSTEENSSMESNENSEEIFNEEQNSPEFGQKILKKEDLQSMENIDMTTTESLRDPLISINDTNTAENEYKQSESQEEQTTERITTIQNENLREGRVNKSPTMFLHNNKFYVISGAPEFYANFDAYQNPRTPIFSLQELQPIRPISNVAIQKIEPFRIYVEDNEELKSSTQNDNEPLKMHSTRDNPQSDIENEKSTNVEHKKIEDEKEMTVKVKKREQSRQRLNEARQDFEVDGEETGIAQAIPEAVSISGASRNGSKGTTLTDVRKLSFGSPKETAIAGNIRSIDDSNDEMKGDFTGRSQNRRRVQVLKRKITAERRNWRL